METSLEIPYTPHRTPLEEAVMEEFRTGLLYCGDCLDVMKRLPDNCIDLIYIDPPFHSNRNYEVVFGDLQEVRRFRDRMEGGLDVYVSWLMERIDKMHRLLKPTGSIYIHLGACPTEGWLYRRT